MEEGACETSLMMHVLREGSLAPLARRPELKRGLRKRSQPKAADNRIVCSSDRLGADDAKLR